MNIRKKLAIAAAVFTLMTGAFCSCSGKTDSGISSMESRDEYSVNISMKTDKEIAYEYVDGSDSIEVYYISFGCDVDGLRLERLDENGDFVQTLYEAEAISSERCFKLTTTVPEGMPNTRVVVICGESEYEYELCFNGRDGGADLIPESEL